MNFRPELAAKVMAGEKTVTRRLVSDNPASPWWKERCGLVPGRTYAVCPGRGKRAIGRVLVTDATLMQLGVLTDEEARAEGFADSIAFRKAWCEINGEHVPSAVVWRITFDADPVWSR